MSNRMHRYRYILAPDVHPDDRISGYRLIAGNKTAHSAHMVRVIVDDVRLEKHDCDEYATTSDNRTISQLGYACFARINWKLQRVNLHPIGSKHLVFDDILPSKGYRSAVRDFKGQRQYSYLDEKHYKEYIENLYSKKGDGAV